MVFLEIGKRWANEQKQTTLVISDLIYHHPNRIYPVFFSHSACSGAFMAT